MANRRQEERERLRQARQERESEQAKAGRRRLVIVYAVAGAIGVVVLAGIGIVIAAGGGGGSDSGEAHLNQASGSTNGVRADDRQGTAPPAVKVASLQKSAKQAGCVLRLELEDEGHNHIAASAKTPDYKTNPPTSGSHVEPPYQQADGAYSEMPREIFVVHSLEHGRMAIQYSPDLPEKDQLALKGLYDTMYGGSLLFPNPNMDYAVAATTWTNLLGCPEYKGSITLDAIRDFGEKTWGRYGGEPVNAFALKGPTPAEPKS